MGKKKIPIKEICNRTDLANTYRKRKPGLLKKAYEIVQQCGVEIKMLLSDIDDHVHYYSHIKSENSSFSDFHLDKIMRENKLMTYNTDELKGVFAELNAETVIIDDDRSEKSINFSTKTAANSKTPELFTEAHKKKMMKEKHAMTDSMLKKREIFELLNMEFVNMNTPRDVPKIAYDERFTKKQQPIPLLNSITQLDNKLVNISDMRMKTLYDNISRLNLANPYFYNLEAIIITQTFKYLLDCYHNVEMTENRQISNRSRIINDLLRDFPKEDQIKYQEIIANNSLDKPLMQKLWTINERLLAWIFKSNYLTKENWMVHFFDFTIEKIKELNLEFNSTTELEECVKVCLNAFMTKIFRIEKANEEAMQEQLKYTNPQQFNLLLEHLRKTNEIHRKNLDDKSSMLLEPHNNNLPKSPIEESNNFIRTPAPHVTKPYEGMKVQDNHLSLSNYETPNYESLENKITKNQKSLNIEIPKKIILPEEKTQNDELNNELLNSQQTPKFAPQVPQNMQHYTKMFPYQADLNKSQFEIPKHETQMSEKQGLNRPKVDTNYMQTKVEELKKSMTEQELEKISSIQMERLGSTMSFGQDELSMNRLKSIDSRMSNAMSFGQDEVPINRLKNPDSEINQDLRSNNVEVHLQRQDSDQYYLDIANQLSNEIIQGNNQTNS